MNIIRLATKGEIEQIYHDENKGRCIIVEEGYSPTSGVKACNITYDETGKHLDEVIRMYKLIHNCKRVDYYIEEVM